MPLCEQALVEGLAALQLDLTASQRAMLLHYLELLHKWNRVYSLTAIRDKTQMVSHHLLDSLAVLPYLWPRRWLDVGCGPGLPGVVLAIARPEWTFELLDSNNKKTSFVQQAIIELGLPNVCVHNARVETWHGETKFDGIISRAFTKLGKFVEMTHHVLAARGGWVAMKGRLEKELLPESVRLEKALPLMVPGLKAARSVIILREKHGEDTRHH